MKTMESKSHTKYETEFFLKLYVDQKCCEANFKKTQNYEISDSLDYSHHLHKEGKRTSRRNESFKTITKLNHVVKDSGKRQSR